MNTGVATSLMEELESYRIGEKLRRLRLKKSMGLVELGRHTGLSPGLLSKIERGKLHPTLPTLLRIATAFSLGLDYFFVGPRKRPVVAVARRSERHRFNGLQEGNRTMFQFESLDFRATEKRLSAYWAKFDDAGSVPLLTHSHGGVELLYILRGKLAIEIDGAEHELAQGDAIYFESEVPHGYRKIGSRPAEAVVVTTS